MEPSKRIVTRIPVSSHWNSQGPISGTRGKVLGTGDIQARLQKRLATLVVAECGEPLRWVLPEEVFEVWKNELKARTVQPNEGAEQGFGFRLGDYPGGYCYIATEWAGSELPTLIVFEMHH